MKLPTEPLREEHRRLRPRLATLRALADKVDTAPAADVNAQLDDTLAFLEQSLLPHALSEDAVLYPEVALAMGAEQSTATMSRDHLEIARLTDQLRYLRTRFARTPTSRMRADIRRILYGLEAITHLHVDKEEEIYLPLLDEHLTPEGADDLFAALRESHEQATRARTPRAS